jgi:hypothetical protein
MEKEKAQQQLLTMPSRWQEGMAGTERGRNMKQLIVVLAAGFALAGVELGLGASEAEAATSFCKHRYSLCLARCPETLRCSSRCRTQYKYCANPYPYIGSLL